MNRKSHPTIHYGGIWARLIASLIDSFLLSLAMIPVAFLFMGAEFVSLPNMPIPLPLHFVSWIFPIAIILIFWHYKSATPGKIMLSLKIVDSKTLGKPQTKQLIYRYLGYYVSAFVLMMGFIWIAFDKRKQGWHDKIAKTVVIYDKPFHRK